MKRTLKPIFPPAGIEREYEKRLKKAVREMEHSVVYWLRARYRANESKIVGDSATDDLLKAFRKLLHQWERNFRELADVLPKWFVSKIILLPSILVSSLVYVPSFSTRYILHVLRSMYEGRFISTVAVNVSKTS